MKKNSIMGDGIKVNMLSALSTYGAIESALLRLMTCPSLSMRANFTHATKKLSESSLIKRKANGYFAITPEGSNFLKENGVRTKPFTEIRYTNSRVRRARNQSILSTIAMCEASGFCIAHRLNVSLPDICREETEGLPDDIRNFLDDNISRGIYFSTGSMLALLKENGNNNEALIRSRITGVVLTKNRIVFLYYTGENPYKWFPNSESTVTNLFADLILSNKLLGTFIEEDAEIGAVILAKGYAIVPKLVFGNRSGRNLDSERNTLSLLSETRLTAENLSNVFKNVTCVAVDCVSVPLFREAVLETAATERTKAYAWLDKFVYGGHSAERRYYQGISKDMVNVVYLPKVDPVKLLVYKMQGRESIVVCNDNPRIITAVSRSLGELVKSMRSFKGKILEYPTFDNDGRQLSGKPIAPPAPPKKEKTNKKHKRNT